MKNSQVDHSKYLDMLDAPIVSEELRIRQTNLHEMYFPKQDKSSVESSLQELEKGQLRPITTLLRNILVQRRYISFEKLIEDIKTLNNNTSSTNRKLHD